VSQVDRDTSIGRATVRQVCAAFRISRQAYYQALRSPLSNEPANDEPVGRRSGPWVSDDELIERIPGVVENNPGWGSRKVWASLTRQGLTVSRRRVWKRMQALGLLLPAPQHLPRERRGKVTVPDSNRLWGTDLTTIYTREDGLVAVVPVIDFGDRFVLSCQVMKSQESWSVLAPTEAALQHEFGRPSCVPDGLEWRTDHGPQFVGGDSELLVRRWGIDHTLAPVGRPTGNAVTERFILTLKTELLWARDWDSLAEVERAVAEWLPRYNHERPHQALGWRTPAERRAHNLNARSSDRAA
jgi:putative transposase